MSKIFKPRRGKKSTMNGTKANTVLALGEMLFEVPDTGTGTGQSKAKMGDGTKAYSQLPYAFGDTANDTVEFLESSATTKEDAINGVTSGSPLKTLLSNLKKAISLTDGSLTSMNTNIASQLTELSTKLDDVTPNDAYKDNAYNTVVIVPHGTSCLGGGTASTASLTVDKEFMVLVACVGASPDGGRTMTVYKNNVAVYSNDYINGVARGYKVRVTTGDVIRATVTIQNQGDFAGGGVCLFGLQ